MKNTNKTDKCPTINCCSCFSGWVFFFFLLGAIVGFGAHYVVVNWNGFFATCSDGSKPDKNGCCPGEFFTDAGDGWMVCCPAGSDHCYPPMK